MNRLDELNQQKQQILKEIRELKERAIVYGRTKLVPPTDEDMYRVLVSYTPGHYDNGDWKISRKYSTILRVQSKSEVLSELNAIIDDLKNLRTLIEKEDLE